MYDYDDNIDSVRAPRNSSIWLSDMTHINNDIAHQACSQSLISEAVEPHNSKYIFYWSHLGYKTKKSYFDLIFRQMLLLMPYYCSGER